MGMEGRNNITGVVMGEVYYPPPHPYAVAQGFPMNNNNPSAPLEPPPPPPPSQGFDMNNNGYVPPPPPPPPPQGFATSNNNTSCAPPPPAVSVANTNVYVNTEERVKGYAVAVAVAEPGLPCCGIGVGWTLFILGWFLCGIPWYVGAIIIFCSKVDRRERAGYIACVSFALIITVVAIAMRSTKK